MHGYSPSIHYGFVRARQLEGTFPGDKQTGVWPITGRRISYGWGQPPEESWPYLRKRRHGVREWRSGALS